MKLPDINVVLAVVFGLVVIYLLAKMLFAPARLLARLLITACMGAIFLFIFNLVAGFFGVRLGINAATALVAGYMGIPGMIMLALLQRMLG